MERWCCVWFRRDRLSRDFFFVRCPKSVLFALLYKSQELWFWRCRSLLNSSCAAVSAAKRALARLVCSPNSNVESSRWMRLGDRMAWISSASSLGDLGRRWGLLTNAFWWICFRNRACSWTQVGPRPLLLKKQQGPVFAFREEVFFLCNLFGGFESLIRGSIFSRRWWWWWCFCVKWRVAAAAAAASW